MEQGSCKEGCCEARLGAEAQSHIPQLHNSTLRNRVGDRADGCIGNVRVGRADGQSGSQAVRPRLSEILVTPDFE
jgi:hypothetical protein